MNRNEFPESTFSTNGEGYRAPYIARKNQGGDDLTAWMEQANERSRIVTGNGDTAESGK
ncbi:MAG: hypothetical protein WC846_01340 [Candidatus Gracilibacteria bacterium]|jgi:hypothetical protein